MVLIYNVLLASKLIIIRYKTSNIIYEQSNYRGENVHLFKRISRCSNSGFQGWKGSEGSTLFYIFNQSHEERSWQRLAHM